MIMRFIVDLRDVTHAILLAPCMETPFFFLLVSQIEQQKSCQYWGRLFGQISLSPTAFLGQPTQSSAGQNTFAATPCNNLSLYFPFYCGVIILKSRRNL